MDHIDEISEYRTFTVGQITILNYSHVFPPKWVKVKAVLANGNLAIVLMQTKDGLEWIDHHFVVSTASLGFKGNMPEKVVPTNAGLSTKNKSKKLQNIKFKVAFEVNIKTITLGFVAGFSLYKVIKLSKSRRL